MGLDSVEMVMEVEDEFGVSLPDAECEKVRTVRDLVQLIARHLPRASGHCPTAQEFYRFRSCAIDTLALDARVIRPSTLLASLFPLKSRLAKWSKLAAGHASMPRLSPPRATRIALGRAMTAVTVLWLGLGVWIWLSLVDPISGAVVVMLGVIALMLIYQQVYRMLSTEFPDECDTVGDLVRRTTPVVIHDDPVIRAETEALILLKVRHIAAEQLDLKLSDVKADSDFVHDLDMD